MTIENIKVLAITLLQKQWVRVLTPAIAGFIAYGTWGCIANFAYDISVWIKAGLTQGSISFVTNLVIASLMETIFKITQRKDITVGVTIPTIIGSAYAIHTLAGTPNILLTIAPSATIGSIYVFGYVSALVLVSNQQTG